MLFSIVPTIYPKWVTFALLGGAVMDFLPFRRENAPGLLFYNSPTNLYRLAVCLFDGAENLIHHLRDDGVAVGFEGFGAPLAERNGKVVHIKGKPIISSVNRGDSRKALPSFTWSRFPAAL